MIRTTRSQTMGIGLALSLLAALAGGACATAPADAPARAAATAPAERAVRATLEDYVKAQNDGLAAGRVDAFLPFLAEDAEIDSTVAGGRVTKAGYASAIGKWLERVRVRRVSFREPSRAVVETESLVYRLGSFTQPAWSTARRIDWTLEQRGGRWLIVAVDSK
jgi:hypothetical protein